MHRTRVVAATFLLAIAAANAGAQLATPEARSFAMGNAYSARARGYESSFWNPANLGLSENTSWSTGLNASAFFTNNALGYNQVTGLYGDYLDAGEKSQLLSDLRESTGGDLAHLRFDVGAQGLGVSYGRFAAGFGGIGAGSAEITPDALELLLFGNVGESGDGRDFNFAGTVVDIWTLYGAHASYAQPFRLPALPAFGFSAGATVRYGVARDLLRITENNSELIYEPLVLDVDLQKLQSKGGNAGSAFAMDFGLAMEWSENLVVGASLINAVQYVQWDSSAFEVTSYGVDADYSDIAISSTKIAYEDLDADGKQRIDELLDDANLPRRLRLGSMFRVSPQLDLSADYVELIGGSLRSRWERTLSTGAEIRIIPMLPLRAGFATSFEQFALTGGIGLHAGPVHTDFAIGRWGLGGGDGIVTSLSMSYWPGF